MMEEIIMVEKQQLHGQRLLWQACSMRMRIGFLVGAMLLGSLSLAPLARAADEQSYKALRDWIEQYRTVPLQFTVGQTLTEKDRALLEPFIPQSAWKYYFFDGMEMEIAPTAHYPAPPDWGKDVQSGYSLDQNGVLVGFTGGGFPFPDIKPDDPQAAVKVIWNMLWRPGTQDFVMPMVAWSRSENGQLDRQYEFVSISAEYAKGDYCLVPGYEEVRGKSLMEFRSPRDMAGAKNLSVSYVDHYKEDSGWLYMPAQRKPRRTLASERTSEVMGMDFTREDQMGFGGKVHEQNWTYLGKKHVLTTINVRDNPEAGGPHLWVPNRARWEVRECHVLLIDPKAENHPYSHKIVFIDAETFWTHWMFAFDRKEHLLRMAQHFLKYSESYAEETTTQAPYMELDFSNNIGHNVFIHLGETDINAQKPHATFSHCYVMKKNLSAGRAKQFYSVRNMVSGRR
jgi:hypothetical protein